MGGPFDPASTDRQRLRQRGFVKTMKEKARVMVLASFAADSFALGAHWMYDTEAIFQRYGRIEHLLPAAPNSYHAGKEKGEFTHYGDQTLELLESIAECSEFSLTHFANKWRGLFDEYPGYVDKATTATLQNFAAGRDPSESGSSSTDLAGAARTAPLVYRYRHNLHSLLFIVKAQTRMTHNHPDVIGSAEFFARVAWNVLGGLSPVTALESVRDEFFNELPFSKWVSDGIESARWDTRGAIARFGQNCETRCAFPSTVHLLARYQNDYREALIENVMAGGDSAARGLIVGMILGARLGYEAVPTEWLEGLKQSSRIRDLLDIMDRECSEEILS